MSDYRYLVYPQLHKKCNFFIILKMLKTGMSLAEVVKAAKAQQKSVSEI